MSLINSILNVVALLLWLNWRSLGLAGASRSAGISLLATLKETSAHGAGRWLFLLALAVLLALRSVFYWQIGAAVNWTPNLSLSVVVLPFRSDFLGRIALFSLLSFGQLLLGFYFWLFLLSAVNRNIADRDPVQKMVRLHLGWLDRGPAVLKLLLPWLVGAALWAGLNPVFVRLGLLPAPISGVNLSEQAFVVGASTLLAWKFLLLGCLCFHFLNAYVFMGDLALWKFLNATAANLLRPIAWLPLRLGRLDLTPVVGIALVLVITEMGVPGLTQVYQRLTLGP